MKKILVIGLLLVIARTVFAYKVYRTDDGIPIRWYTEQVTMVGDSAGTADVPGTAEWQAVTASMATWNQVDCDQPKLEFNGLKKDAVIGYSKNGSNLNVIRWVNDKQEWEDRYIGNDEVIAFTTVMFDQKTGEILDADMELNDWNFTFTVSGVRSEYDVQNTVTHELGHVLGMDHSTHPDATMFYSANKGDINKRTLSQDDMDGLCYLYERNWGEKDEMPDGRVIPPETKGKGGGCNTGTRNNPLILLMIFALLFFRSRSKL